jgi:SAM-dependent methyltransferase
MLKTDAELEASAVVANNAMNRERGLSGVNSYTKTLGFDPYAFLRDRRDAYGRAAWLDLCCGEGNALIEAAARFAADGARADAADGGGGVSVVGVDLVGRLGITGKLPPGLRLITAPVTAWRTDDAFDLVTCVHGLHYVGDKLALLERIPQWLTETGRFVADFDASLVRRADGAAATLRVARTLRRAGAEYDGRHHRVSWQGPIPLDFDARYLGADDASGPGYTGQPAVASHYAWRDNPLSGPV